ncbi:MAG: hypothetical protein JXD18_09920 [Anaerolineae bacterium]|nr:hypothetical protein [Anaerolineae bacterium]
MDFVGADGSAAGVVDAAAAVDSVITCSTCHNEATAMLDSVTFPSGVVLAGLGDEARCMICHQGRESGVSVDALIAEAGVGDDEVSENLRFLNVHYAAAAATQYGSFAIGGYQYAGMTYDARFAHVPEYDTCFECHDSHSLEVKVEECTACHTDVAGAEDLPNLRLVGSTVDYDGDGDVSEGIAFEIQGLQEILGGALTANGVVYNADAYPYFFDEAGERFAAWTPRLLRAAYNYQFSMKDHGAYAHGGKYIIQLLYDSIADLDAALAEGLHRNDAGHFDGSSEAWRHWDEDGMVEADCARCHSATGLPVYIHEGVNVEEPLSNGMLCTTCHDSYEGFTRYVVEAVEFPSGATLAFESPDANLCLNCHQGRQAGADIAAAIEGLDDDAASDSLRFLNVHYFAAGATLFGSEAAGVYEYPGQEYVGRFAHVAGFDTCVSCHDAHALELNAESCSTCHAGVADAAEIRISETDYDGDGDVEEGLAGEVATMTEALYAAMQDYSAGIGNAVVYDGHAYPYFFNEAGERYAGWTPRLLRAAYNYQYFQKDPGAYAHNGIYSVQVLYDAIADLGGDVSGMTRP